ncbi:MAG TPA: diguanylate cyclase [Gammaproteobacteria bacterium]|jgi:diguanylate cyclase (GGDEF)-like protein|nr:diguanylate cyclase [Gammaproteobacteria bacterium]
MAESSLSGPGPVTSSPYTEELALGVTGRAFGEPLEREYLRSRLAEDRTLIRVASVLVLVIAGARGTEQILKHAWAHYELVQFVVTLACSIVLAVVAFTPWFQRAYMPLARVLVPLRNALVAVTVASTAAGGEIESLMLLPLLVIGPFFVHGLRYRAAVAAVSLTVAAYVLAAVGFGLTAPLILRSCLLQSFVAAACGFVALHLERTSRRSFLESHLIADLAQRDALTGLKNRRVFDEQLESLWSRASAEARTLTLMLIDVDHFKAYNDRYGHQAGDHALQRVAATLQTFVTRPHDVVARYGGEEFAAVFFDLETFDAEELAERLRRAVGTLALDTVGDARASAITISVGVAVVEPSGERRARGGVQLADQALYRAKVKGRNRVELLDQSAHQAMKTGVFAATSVTQR